MTCAQTHTSTMRFTVFVIASVVMAALAVLRNDADGSMFGYSTDALATGSPPHEADSSDRNS